MMLRAALLAMFPHAALADVCDQVDALMAQVSGSAEVVVEGAVCRRSIALGGAQSIACNWAYPYRSTEATAAFDAMSAALTRCADPVAIEDAQVSHPDSYVLRQFALGEGLVSLSLKDKGGLNETHVFVRVTR